MSRRTWPWLPLALLTIAGLSFYRVQFIASAADPSAIETPHKATPAAPIDNHVSAPLRPLSVTGHLAGTLRQAIDLRSALENMRSQLHPDAPLLHALSEEVRVACSVARRPDAESVQVEGDPNRRIWIDALMRRCAGLRDADLQPPELTGEALRLWNRQLPEYVAFRESMPVALQLAREQAEHSPDARMIIESLRFLLDHGELPMHDIFVGVLLPTRADIEAALIAAADWIACERSGACGADGLWTLYTCAQFGCPVGSDLPLALFRTLPAQQFEIAQRLTHWAR